ncbi:Ricin-type beta-trefoil lectin domain-containing protein [Amycolatopsis xylanica]|uniref:Ricin-type beta-trefoil lectin domain-containing protein n=1 Tax=Amycolatopsis xylanica TaxID=589385 RepID=A0A1H3NRF4_9PSEU|nr:ThuA domain-containing protein [Amycolatopsis xylanica]SDY91414.1 Ricin-type beta-trefoil lectin domain-containing protein [Amycolatopsis xylanica]
MFKKKLAKVLAFFGVCVALAGTPAYARPEAPAFKVLAFYNYVDDQAHVSFYKEANPWFTNLGNQNNFSYTATTDWNLLNTITASQYQVVMFLDDLPHTASQRAGFERYMRNGGGWFGFHVSAYNEDPNSWAWYHSQFLATGRFRNNTWGPTKAVLKVDDQTHPSTLRLGSKFTSAVSEWYSWNNDLRTNPDIRILASVDPSSFPLGTDPDQSWYSGYYPIMWTNKNYKMLYANFGHNAMNYQTNTPLSSTFESETQNKFLLDGLLWLGGGGSVPPADPDQPSPSAWYSVVNKGNGKCVDAKAAGTANGTVVQQYTCNASFAQQYQFQPTSGGFTRVNNRNNPAQVIDVAGVSTADNAPLHLWAYGGGNNQQWQAVPEGGGYFHFVSRNTPKCLTVPNGSTADSVQLVQLTCNGGAAQSFKLTQQ